MLLFDILSASLFVRKPLLEIGIRLLSSMAQALQTHGVVPDVIDKVPENVLKVTYPNQISVDIGKVLTPTQVKDKPNVTWNGDANTYYTLCMTGKFSIEIFNYYNYLNLRIELIYRILLIDPDAPSRKNPKFREWHHWLIGNIPGSEIAKGDVLSDYIGSGPPKDTGLHRYVFLLYKQPGKLTFDERRLTNRSGQNRGNFSIRKFATKYKLGDPIAANMYQAEFDDYVPLLYKQLEG